MRVRAGFALAALVLTTVARAQTITEFPVATAGCQPGGITAGPDGNLWFTEFHGNKIGRITTAGTITEFPTAAATNPELIAVGSDGNLWFPEVTSNTIGRMTTAGGYTSFPILTAAASVIGIAAGSDGNLWFVEAQKFKIGRITTAGVVTEFPVPTQEILLQIASGPDGNLWFAEFNAGKIGRITTAGVVTEFPVPFAGSQPQGITGGPDGNIWFTDTGRNTIGRITPTGAFTEFPIPSADANLLGIITGPDGNLWFAEDDVNKIGRITPSGVVTEFPIPTGNAGPVALAAGPDGNVWFTEVFGNNVARINLSSLSAQPASVDAHAVAGTNSNVNGVLEPGETVEVSPSWENTLVGAQAVEGSSVSLAGPAGGTYIISDSSADYGSIAGGATADCHDATGNCFQITVSGARPVPHWDATLTEVLTVENTRWARTIHVGNSFPDVPTTHPFYAFIENLFHSGATGGCGLGNYCPAGDGDAGADGRLPAQGQVRIEPRASARDRNGLHRRAHRLVRRRLDRGARGSRDHGRLRRRKLLPQQSRHARADGRLPAEVRARRGVRAAELRRDLRRRAVPVAVCELGRAARRRGNHGRMRRQQLLS